MLLGLSQAHWELVGARAPHAGSITDATRESERLMAASALGGALKNSSPPDYEGALPLFEESLSGYRRLLGEAHPGTLTAMSNLAELHHCMENYEQALPLATTCLAATRRLVGNEHPQTLLSIGNTAALHSDMGHHSLALPLREEGLATSRRTLGNQHAQTLSAMHDMSDMHYRLGELASAVKLGREAVSGDRQTLGEDHPQTQRHVRNLQLMEARAEASGGPLTVGTVVTVFGLMAAPELNGREGVVEGFDEVKERCIVRVKDERKLKKIKPANCRATV
jgi:hypothetical protein